MFTSYSNSSYIKLKGNFCCLRKDVTSWSFSLYIRIIESTLQYIFQYTCCLKAYKNIVTVVQSVRKWENTMFILESMYGMMNRFTPHLTKGHSPVNRCLLRIFCWRRSLHVSLCIIDVYSWKFLKNAYWNKRCSSPPRWWSQHFQINDTYWLSCNYFCNFAI